MKTTLQPELDILEDGDGYKVRWTEVGFETLENEREFVDGLDLIARHYDDFFRWIAIAVAERQRRGVMIN